MKKIFQTFFEKWPEYLLEILVITIGILGAFTLNNWKERSNTQEQVRRSLQNVISELEDDSVQFHYQQESSSQTLENLRNLLDVVLNPNSSTDSMEYFYHKSRSFILYVPQNSSFQSMNQLGLLQYISNPDLLYQIQNYYTFTQPNVKILRDIEEQRFKENMNTINTDPAIIMKEAGWDDLPLDYNEVKSILQKPENFRKVYRYGKIQEYLISRSEGYVSTNAELLAMLRSYLKE
ncbi:hypothetical protein [Ekhidna sp.]